MQKRKPNKQSEPFLPHSLLTHLFSPPPGNRKNCHILYVKTTFKHISQNQVPIDNDCDNDNIDNFDGYEYDNENYKISDRYSEY